MLRLLVILFLTATPAAADCVILLHGLARSGGTWTLMEPLLRRDFPAVVNATYASTEYEIDKLAHTVIPDAVQACPDEGRIHVVTHSMGGILLRVYMETAEIPRFGRAVMIAPPNQGSELVDELGDLALMEWVNGPAGMQLGTGPDSVPSRLGPLTFEAGVIAGRTSYNPLYDLFIDGENDGKVTVESTRVDGMADHLVVDAGHTFIAMKPEVIRQVRTFLQTGAFSRP